MLFVLLVTFTSVLATAGSKAPFGYCGSTGSEPAKATIPSLTNAQKIALGKAELVKVVSSIRHGDRMSFGWYSPPHGPLGRKLCWPAENTVWNCQSTHMETTSQNQSRVFTEYNITRLFRKSYDAGKNVLRGNCATGQLTTLGQQQQRANGLALRDAYVLRTKLLPSDWRSRPSDFYLHADDVPRVQMSVESLFQGMFPNELPSGNAEILDLFTRDLDVAMMFPNPTLCPRLGELAQEAVNSKAYEAWSKSVLDPFLAKISKIVGYNNVSADILSDLTDCIRVHLCHSKGIPSGFTSTVLTQLSTIATYLQMVPVIYPNSTIGSRLSIGFFLDAVQQHLKSPHDGPKFVLYGGHDTTFMSILAGFQVPFEWPPYATTMTFEVYAVSNLSTPSAIRVVYNGHALNLPECTKTPGICEWSEWISQVQDLIPTDPVKECTASGTLHRGVKEAMNANARDGRHFWPFSLMQHPLSEA